jgi:hypothetical protein
MDVGPEGRPLSTGSPGFLIPHLNIIILNKIKILAREIVIKT